MSGDRPHTNIYTICSALLLYHVWTHTNIQIHTLSLFILFEHTHTHKPLHTHTALQSELIGSTFTLPFAFSHLTDTFVQSSWEVMKIANFEDKVPWKINCLHEKWVLDRAGKTGVKEVLLAVEFFSIVFSMPSCNNKNAELLSLFL